VARGGISLPLWAAAVGFFLFFLKKIELLKD
jgi:hypothetical protein